MTESCQRDVMLVLGRPTYPLAYVPYQCGSHGS